MKLELLMVLAAAALLSNLSDSRIVSKCDLKNDLVNISMASTNKNNILAMIICELENISKLNTSLVTIEGHHQPTSTNQPKTATEGNANRPKTTATANGTAPSGGRQEHSPPKREPEGKEKQTSNEKETSKYGIFQLSNREFCKSGNVPSQNKCHTNCSAFTDDNITDDIKCFLGQGYWRLILEEVSKECRNHTKTFFSQCN